MPHITIIDNLGQEHAVEARAGATVMQAVLSHRIDGVVAECGGACACGTCHCYVDAAWLDRLPAMSAIERETLECAIEVGDTSRLSCQITLSDQLDGLRVRLPKSQL